VSCLGVVLLSLQLLIVFQLLKHTTVVDMNQVPVEKALFSSERRMRKCPLDKASDLSAAIPNVTRRKLDPRIPDGSFNVLRKRGK